MQRLVLYECQGAKPYYMQKLGLLFGCLLMLAAGCKKDKESGITGTWVLDSSDMKVSVYHRASQLEEDKKGYIFKSNGELVRRDQAGYCAIPYGNYDGNWTAQQNSKLVVSTKNWNEPVFNRQFEVVLVTATQLKLKHL